MTPKSEWFPRKRDRLRRNFGSVIAKSLFEITPAIARQTPLGNPERYGVEKIKNIPYLNTGRKEHLLDVYRPKLLKENAPVVLYIHGGGFRICSKDSHWMFGLEYAKAGYVVFNINYRLAPRFPFPAGLHDAAHAYRWVVEHAHEYGGDISNLFVAGESAGGNFACNIALAKAFERSEPYLAPVLQSQQAPKGILPACAFLDLGNDAFHSQQALPKVVLDRMRSITEAYVGPSDWPRHERDLISPLVFLENAPKPKHHFPPTFIACGGADVIRNDSARLEQALKALDIEVEYKLYPKEPHAFHALTFRKVGRECWNDHINFIKKHTE